MKRMEEYVQKHGLCYSEQDMLNLKNSFTEEMEHGLAGHPGTLKMIPAYLNAEIEPEGSHRVLAVDMGGTNFRVSSVEVTGRNMKIVSGKKSAMPGTNGTLSREEFFLEVAKNIAEEAARCDAMGLCFSFPCEIEPTLDGKILNFNKEVSVRDAQGAMLKEEINRALKKIGVPEIRHITVINDTVAALLGAKAGAAPGYYDDYIGFILGTGTNSCYSEDNRNILKSKVLRTRSGRSLVNLESGGFGAFERTAVDVRFDSRTSGPGTQLFEKMISGAYQTGLALEYIKDAAELGCFTEKTSRMISELNALKPQELDLCCTDPEEDNSLKQLIGENAQDWESVHLLADALFSRAASMTVASLLAIIEKTGKGKSREHPVCIAAEGSTFYKCLPLHRKIMRLAQDYMQGQLGFYAEFAKTEESTLLGSALAALSAPADVE